MVEAGRTVRKRWSVSPAGLKVFTAPFRRGPAPGFGRPVSLFEGKLLGDFVMGRNYDAAPNGRLLLVSEKEQPPITRIEVVVNWFEELRSRLAGASR
ncbi:MAG: hypothetical protein ACRD3M_11725 [Thermoanaerobaculia bacterium]